MSLDVQCCVLLTSRASASVEAHLTQAPVVAVIVDATTVVVAGNVVVTHFNAGRRVVHRTLHDEEECHQRKKNLKQSKVYFKHHNKVINLQLRLTRTCNSLKDLILKFKYPGYQSTFDPHLLQERCNNFRHQTDHAVDPKQIFCTLHVVLCSS